VAQIEKRPAGRRLVRHALYGQADHFRVARNPSRVDAKRGDHFLQADLSLLIGSTWITSSLPTSDQNITITSISPDSRFSAERLPVQVVIGSQWLPFSHVKAPAGGDRILLLARLRYGDFAAAEYFKLIFVHHDNRVGINPDTQQFRMRRDYWLHITFAMTL
jgi:hypothetical protein